MKVKKWVYEEKPIDKKSGHYKNFIKTFRKYKKFVEKNNRLPMQSSTTQKRPKAETRLYAWASGKKYRAAKRLLPQYQFELLDSIQGFAWNTQNNVWFQRLTELAEHMLIYNESPGQLRPERFPERVHKGKWISPVDAKLHTLSVWCMVQRRAFKKGTLLPDRMNHLIDIGFDFEPVMGPKNERGDIKGMDSMENINYLKKIDKYSWRYSG